MSDRPPPRLRLADRQQSPLLRGAAGLIAIGALAGMTSVILISFLSQARIFLAMAREMSAAVTCPVGPTAVRAASAESPVPVAMSRTCMPGAISAERNKNGMKCAVTCAKARSYSAAASSLKLSSSGIPGSRFLSSDSLPEFGPMESSRNSSGATSSLRRTRSLSGLKCPTQTAAGSRN